MIKKWVFVETVGKLVNVEQIAWIEPSGDTIKLHFAGGKGMTLQGTDKAQLLDGIGESQRFLNSRPAPPLSADEQRRRDAEEEDEARRNSDEP